MQNNSIDFIITWVDDSDSNWIKDRNQYNPAYEADNGACRYRDWDLLKFWFRGVEQFAPWVRKIHFVTYGHLPKWLNINHPQLNVVEHQDFIPHQYLPTFSSHPIELNMHRISGLSEKFVYFNDDMFLLSKTDEVDFFKNELPRDEAVLDYITSIDRDIFPHILINNIDVLNKHYNKQKVMKNHFKKWYTFHYGLESFSKNILLSWTKNFPGIKWRHLCQSYLKSTFSEVWATEETLLDETCNSKFRNIRDINPYVFRYWQLAKGDFIPTNLSKLGQVYHLPDGFDELNQTIRSQKMKIVCINDTEKCTDIEIYKNILHKSFNQILSSASSYELK